MGIAVGRHFPDPLCGRDLIQCTTPTPGNNACITPAAVAPLGIDVTNTGPLSPLQVIFVNQPNYRPPIAQQASFGIERRDRTLASRFLSAASMSHTQRLPVAIDTNLLPAPFSTVTLANGADGFLSQLEYEPGGRPCWAAPRAFPVRPRNCFVNPLIVQNNQYTSEPTLFTRAASWKSKSASVSTSACSETTHSAKASTRPRITTPTTGRRIRRTSPLIAALSEFDQRHKVVIAGVLDSPWKQVSCPVFQLAPIFEAHSGHPFNLLAGGEVNGDNHTTNERPIGAPRDTGLGPDYVDFDMRLSWAHKLGEKCEPAIHGGRIQHREPDKLRQREQRGKSALRFRSGIHDVQRARDSTGPALAGGGTATSSTPLAFTSAFPKRQIQLGVRFSF